MIRRVLLELGRASAPPVWCPFALRGPRWDGLHLGLAGRILCSSCEPCVHLCDAEPDPRFPRQRRAPQTPLGQRASGPGAELYPRGPEGRSRPHLLLILAAVSCFLGGGHRGPSVQGKRHSVLMPPDPGAGSRGHVWAVQPGAGGGLPATRPHVRRVPSEPCCACTLALGPQHPCTGRPVSARCGRGMEVFERPCGPGMEPPLRDAAFQCSLPWIWS